MLAFREGSILNSMTEDEYKATLRKNHEQIKSVRNEEEVCKILRELGYKASYLVIPDSRFATNPFIIDPIKDLPTIITDLID